VVVRVGRVKLGGQSQVLERRFLRHTIGDGGLADPNQEGKEDGQFKDSRKTPSDFTPEF
jgi:hypothetical protein